MDEESRAGNSINFKYGKYWLNELIKVKSYENYIKMPSLIKRRHFMLYSI